MSTIRGRFLVILGLVAASAISLLPRHETQRVPDPVTGRMKDTTVRRVPINLGLDLRGAGPLRLESDQPKGPGPACATPFHLPSGAVRTPVAEFAPTDPVVQ